jgi:acyl dehydratase
MGWAVAQDGWTGLTGRLRVRFVRPVGPGQALRVRAWVLAYRHRVARAAAEVVSPGGVRVAEAEGLLRLGQVVPPVEALP